MSTKPTIVRCDAHPGRHEQRGDCRGVRRDNLADRVVAWLEDRLNPKKGRPA
jgi:hypothetical protein